MYRFLRIRYSCISTRAFSRTGQNGLGAPHAGFLPAEVCRAAAGERQCLRLADGRPSQILDSALSRLPTPSLLRLAAVNRRFYSVVVRLLNRRLARATTLPQHQVILECFHPSARQSTPYLLCKYLGTDGLDHGPVAAREGGAEHTLDLGDCLDLQDMKRLYSRFRPVPQEASLWPGVHFQGLSAAAEHRHSSSRVAARSEQRAQQRARRQTS